MSNIAEDVRKGHVEFDYTIRKYKGVDDEDQPKDVFDWITDLDESEQWFDSADEAERDVRGQYA